MASQSNPSDSSREAVLRRQNNGPAFKFLFPLVYAPVLPLIRISLRKNPVVRDRLFIAVLAGAFAHGLYLVFDGGAKHLQLSFFDGGAKHLQLSYFRKRRLLVAAIPIPIP